MAVNGVCQYECRILPTSASTENAVNGSCGITPRKQDELGNRWIVFVPFMRMSLHKCKNYSTFVTHCILLADKQIKQKKYE